MLDYTIVATKKTVDDIKRFTLVFSILTQILYIAYLAYALISNVGFTWLNIPLLAVSVAYFVFYLVIRGKNGKKIKECTNCTFPHKAENYETIMKFLSI